MPPLPADLTHKNVKNGIASNERNEFICFGTFMLMVISGIYSTAANRPWK